MAGANEVKAGAAFIEILGDWSKLKTALVAASKRVKSFAGTIGSSVASLTPVFSIAVGGLKKIGGAITRVAGVFVSLGKMMFNAMVAVGKAIASAAGRLKDFISSTIKRSALVLGAALAFATREAVNFESAMAEVGTLMTVSAKQMASLSSRVADMSAQFGQSPVSVAKALYQTISAGVTEATDALELMNVASKAAVAGLTSTFSAVDVLTTVMNTYGKTVKEATLISDQMFVAVREGKTTFAELSSSLGPIASLAAQAGLGFDQLMAAIATLTKGGIRTDAAVTALRATLVSIISPSAEAVEVAKDLGIAFSAQALSMVGLPNILRQVKRATRGNVETMAKLFPNIRALSGVMNLAGSQAKEFRNQLRNMKNASGATDTAFKKMAKTAKFKLAQAWEVIRGAFLRAGTFVMPFVVKAVQNVSKAFATFTTWMRRNAPKIREVLSKTFATIGTILSRAGNFILDLAKKIISGEITLSNAFSDVIRDVFTTVLDVLEEFIPKMAEIGSELLGSILDGLSAKEEGGTSVIDRLGELISLIVTEALSVVEERKADIAKVGRKVVDAILDTFDKKDPKTGKTVVERVGVLVGDLIGELAKVVKDKHADVAKIGGSVIRSLLEGFTTKGEGGKSALDSVKDMVTDLETTFRDAVKNKGKIWSAIGGDIAIGIITGIWNTFILKVGLLMEKMERKIKEGFGNILDRAFDIGKGIPGIGAGLKSAATPTGSDIKDVNRQPPDPSIVGGGPGGNITINNNFKQDNSDIERLTRDARRLKRRGRF